jgi:hypothetical protein
MFKNVMIRLVVKADLVPATLAALQPRGGNHESQSAGEGVEILKYQGRGAYALSLLGGLLDGLAFVGVYPQNLGDGRYALKFVFRDPSTVTVDADELARRQDLRRNLEYFCSRYMWQSVMGHSNPLQGGARGLCINLSGPTPFRDESGGAMFFTEKQTGNTVQLQPDVRLMADNGLPQVQPFQPS